MEGDCLWLLPRRLERATGVILRAATPVSLYHYLRRSWFERGRLGALDGACDSVKWDMVRHIAVVARANRGRYRRVFDVVRLPKLRLDSTRALAGFYRGNGLTP